jgi:hypothetical protein
MHAATLNLSVFNNSRWSRERWRVEVAGGESEGTRGVWFAIDDDIYS